MRRHIVVVGFNVAETAIQGRMSQVPKFSDLWSLWFFIPGLEGMLFDRIAAIIAPNLEEEKRNEEIPQNHYHLRLFLSPTRHAFRQLLLPQHSAGHQGPPGRQAMGRQHAVAPQALGRRLGSKKRGTFWTIEPFEPTSL